MHTNQKSNIVILVVVIILVGLGVYMFLNNIASKQNQNPNPQVALEITGNKDDLVSFSIPTGSKVSGKIDATGVLKGAYFFEANIRVNILGATQNLLKAGNGTATADWMNNGPIPFTTTLDFTGLPTGPGFIQIMNDNPSGDPINDKSIYIPVVIN